VLPARVLLVPWVLAVLAACGGSTARAPEDAGECVAVDQGDGGGVACTRTDCSDPTAAGMTWVPCAGQTGGYCVDATEVTQSSYGGFLTSEAQTCQVGECSWKDSLAPDSSCEASSQVASGPDDPQVCVDWCDAHAYCAAFGKHLCRGIWMSSGNATQDEWYNACSRNGALAFPYGQSFVAGVCNDFSKTYPALTTLPVGSLPGCVGGFPGLFDMSGNAAEWTDSCSGATGASDSCAVRGGSFANTDMDLSCLVAGAQVRSVTSPYFGFRCCL
jgi:formylglycine-generating enzyme